MFYYIIIIGQISQYFPQLPLPVRNFLDIFVGIVVASLIAGVLIKLIRKLFKSRIRWHLIEKFKIQSVSRLDTISELLQNFLLYLIYFVYFYFVLSILGVPIGTLIAGAGIFGIAIGLGAKDLITDVINGFFIIFEGQFQVGDLVALPNLNVTGTILGIGLRTTRVKSITGETYYIPNSEISIINNMSHLNRNILIEIPMDFQMKFKDFENTILRVNQIIANKYDSILIKEPENIGIIKGNNLQFYYRITISVKNSAYYHHTSLFYQEYFDALQDSGYRFPKPYYLHQ